MEQILYIVRDAEPTRSQSVNDQPTNVDAYGTITINTDADPTVVYYYEKDGKYYAGFHRL